jgi:hypothetical protein
MMADAIGTSVHHLNTKINQTESDLAKIRDAGIGSPDRSVPPSRRSVVTP